ncbi:MAG: site-2 protease family protein [Myxococcaceae bacterium]
MAYGGDEAGGEGQWAPVGPVRVRARRRSLRLGAISGIEISLHWTWLIIATLITSSVAMLWLPVVQPAWDGALRWPVAIVCALLFFGSLLLHELAHALMAQRRGIPVLGITLFLFGGVSKLGAEPARARDEFWIAVVGPLASFGLMVVFAGAFLAADVLAVETAATVALYLTLVNFMVGAFNLLPGYPLDGGRILRSAIWGARRNFRSATRVAGGIGRGVAAGLMALGVWLVLDGAIGGLWMALLGMFLWTAGGAQMRQA